MGTDHLIIDDWKMTFPVKKWSLFTKHSFIFGGVTCGKKFQPKRSMVLALCELNRTGCFFFFLPSLQCLMSDGGANIKLFADVLGFVSLTYLHV